MFKDEKAAPVVDSMMRVFSSHILPTFNILHTQFLYLYLASLSPNISNKFLQENWRIFSNPNPPSILRQTAVAYIASFLSRASFVNVNTVMNYLDRLTQWALTYVRTREASSSGMDFMYTDLNHHGPFYAACQVKERKEPLEQLYYYNEGIDFFKRYLSLGKLLELFW